MDKLVSGQPVTIQTAYLIKFATHMYDGYLEKMGTDADTIESIVREEILKRNSIYAPKSVISIEVDLILMWVDVKYIDQLDMELMEKKLFLEEMEVCFAQKDVNP